MKISGPEITKSFAESGDLVAKQSVSGELLCVCKHGGGGITVNHGLKTEYVGRDANSAAEIYNRIVDQEAERQPPDYISQLEAENIAGRRLLWAAVHSSDGRIIVPDTSMVISSGASCKLRSYYDAGQQATIIEAVGGYTDANL
jgi:hypothetical protein